MDIRRRSDAVHVITPAAFEDAIRVFPALIVAAGHMALAVPHKAEPCTETMVDLPASHFAH